MCIYIVNRPTMVVSFLLSLQGLYDIICGSTPGLWWCSLLLFNLISLSINVHRPLSIPSAYVDAVCASNSNMTALTRTCTHHVSPPNTLVMSSKPFYPLAIHPSAPSICQTTFLDFSFHAFNSHSTDLVLNCSILIDGNNSPSPLPPSSPVSSHQTSRHDNLEDRDGTHFDPQGGDRSNIIESSIEDPAFTHPNSPYVPWTSAIRREFLRPLTPASLVSDFTGVYSRPHSRSGARAPEPLDSEVHLPGPNIRSKVSEKLKNLRCTIKFNIKQAAKHFTKLARPFQFCGVRSLPSETLTQSRQVPYSTPVLPSPTPSGESTNTTTLYTWLAERQKEIEEGSSPSNTISIDDYDRRGSWVDIEHTPHDAFTPEVFDFDLLAGKEYPKTLIQSHASILSVLQSSGFLPRMPNSQSLPQLSGLNAWRNNSPPPTCSRYMCASTSNSTTARMPGAWL